MIGGSARMIVRLLALVGKELVEVVRRPGALFSLIIGPFLILAVFGLGYNGVRRPLETIIVIPPSSGLSSDPVRYQDLAGGGLHIAAVVPDAGSAETRLDERAVDVVIVAPEDPAAQFERGEQSVIEVQVNLVDPIQASYAGFLADNLASAVNEEIIAEAVEEGQGYVLSRGASQAAAIPPEVVAAPTRADLINVAPTQPDVVAFFGPAVLALILQHLAITLVALSLVRERTTGVIELFRVSPVTAGEVLSGKVIAFGLIGGAIAAITIVLLVGLLGVPLLGDPWLLVAAIGLELLASMAIGLAIAVLSDSERQAVQLSLLVLLASVFFSGFVLAIEEFNLPVRILAFSLPVTHGIRLMEDIMFRGDTGPAWEYAALGLIALVWMVVAWVGLRRSMARA